MTRPQDLPGWKWMPGMLGHYDSMEGRSALRVSVAPDFGWHSSPNEWGVPCIGAYAGRGGEPGMHMPSNAIPDLSDPATGGCCLALLGDEAWRVRYLDGGGCWECYTGGNDHGFGWPEHPRTSDREAHDYLGAACFAVAEALTCWPGGV